MIIKVDKARVSDPGSTRELSELRWLVCSVN